MDDGYNYEARLRLKLEKPAVLRPLVFYLLFVQEKRVSRVERAGFLE